MQLQAFAITFCVFLLLQFLNFICTSMSRSFLFCSFLCVCSTAKVIFRGGANWFCQSATIFLIQVRSGQKWITICRLYVPDTYDEKIEKRPRKTLIGFLSNFVWNDAFSSNWDTLYAKPPMCKECLAQNVAPWRYAVCLCDVLYML